MAIDWRNVGAPQLGDAGLGVGRGTNNVVGGLNTLADALRGIGAVREQNIQNQKDINTQKALEYISSIDNLKDLENTDVGSIADQYGSLIDRAKVSSSLAGRDDAIMSQTKAKAAFDNFVTTQKEKPHRQAVNALMAQGKFEEARNYASQEGVFTNPYDELNLINAAEDTARTRKLDAENRKIDQDLGNLFDTITVNNMSFDSGESFVDKYINDNGLSFVQAQRVREKYKEAYNSVQGLDPDQTYASNTWNKEAEAYSNRTKQSAKAEYDQVVNNNPVDTTLSAFDNVKSKKDSLEYINKVIPDNQAVRFPALTDVSGESARKALDKSLKAVVKAIPTLNSVDDIDPRAIYAAVSSAPVDTEDGEADFTYLTDDILEYQRIIERNDVAKNAQAQALTKYNKAVADADELLNTRRKTIRREVKNAPDKVAELLGTNYINARKR